MTGSSPYPPGFGAPTPGSGPPPPPGGSGYVPPPANFGQGTAPASERTGLLASGVALAVLLGVAALVLSIINTVRGPATQPPPQIPKHSRKSSSSTMPIRRYARTSDLSCEKKPIGRMPSRILENRIRPHVGQPSRNSRLRLRAGQSRCKALLNEHANPPRYLTRTVQQYIDGMLLYSENLHDDRGPDPFDKPTYDVGRLPAEDHSQPATR